MIFVTIDFLIRVLYEKVQDISYPGFDLLSRYPDGKQRSIEVKGRAGIGNVELTENEWEAAFSYLVY